MDMILAVFRSRAQTIDFVARLKSNGVAASAVSTPKEANVGCGISARIGEFDLPRARKGLGSGRYGAFVGFFRVRTGYGRVFVTRI